jgi:hypothetical protein
MIRPSAILFTEEQKRESFLRLQKYVLETPTPFFIGRLSGNETRICGNILSNIPIPERLSREMLFGAGIQFKDKFDIQTYVQNYMNACKHSHLLGVWDGNMYAQASELYSILYRVCNPNAYICAHALEPYYYMDSPEYKFDQVFANKKVLVITSHQKTTETQIPIVNRIHKKTIFHSTTEFHVYKPPQQNGGNHDTESWRTHFERMKRELLELKQNTFPFDIALVSCGGFGMPISDYIFSDLNTSVIYVGGSLQLYFGIQGKRWDNSDEIAKHINSNWTRPLPEDLPKNPGTCEGGCYW